MASKRLDELVFRAMALISAAKGDSGFSELDSVSQGILFFIGGRQSIGKSVMVSDVVGAEQFGSYPTVQKRLSSLITEGWIDTGENIDDARVVLLELSPKAVQVFNKMSSKLERMALSVKHE